MMKKLFLVFFLSLAVLHLSAQDGLSPEFKARMSEGMVCMSYSWLADNNGRQYGGDGIVVCQDGAFLLKSPDFSVYDDGESMWTVYEAAKEVVGETSARLDITGDPASMLKLFGFEKKGAEVRFINDKEGNLSGIDLKLKDGTQVSIVIPEILFQERDSLAVFSFDPSTLDSSYVVTDLR